MGRVARRGSRRREPARFVFCRFWSGAAALCLRHKRMSWATPYIEKLRKGETVQFRHLGNSMSGKIESWQLCTVVPSNADDLEVGDIVLCKVSGYQYIHLIKARQGDRFQIGNNRGRINGWIGANGIYGKCVRVE